MTQDNALNSKLYTSRINRLESGIKNCTELTVNISSNVIVGSNDETNFLHKVLLTDTQVSRICKSIVND